MSMKRSYIAYKIFYMPYKVSYIRYNLSNINYHIRCASKILLLEIIYIGFNEDINCSKYRKPHVKFFHWRNVNV